MSAHQEDVVTTRGLRFIIGSTVALVVLLSATLATAQDAASIPSIRDKTAGMQLIDGYFPMYWDASAGTLWLEISRFDQEELYLSGLSAGLGSNDIGLDRGQTRSRLVVFERVGPKIFMVQQNYQFRADTDNLDEQRAVEDAFAKSILWGFTVAAETDGRVLVDTTEFLLRDTHGVIPRLRQDGQYRVDQSRSAVHLDRTKGFPENTEIDVTVTFTSAPQGRRGVRAAQRAAARRRRRHARGRGRDPAPASFVRPAPGTGLRGAHLRSAVGVWQCVVAGLLDAAGRRDDQAAHPAPPLGEA